MDNPLEKALMGRWRTQPGDSEYGPCYTELSFGPERSVSATIVFLENDERMSTAGKYEIVEDALLTDVLHKGRPLKLEIDEDVLVLGSGPDAVRYKRSDVARAT